MKNKHATNLCCGILTAIFFLIPVFAIAQDPGGGPDVPVDGGLSLLLAAGAAYGVKKYNDSRTKNKGEQEI